MRKIKTSSGIKSIKIKSGKGFVRKSLAYKKPPQTKIPKLKKFSIPLFIALFTNNKEKIDNTYASVGLSQIPFFSFDIQRTLIAPLNVAPPEFNNNRYKF